MINQMRMFQRFVPLFLIAIVTGQLVGCAAKVRQSEMAAAPLSASQFDELATSYKKVFPNARVGSVAAVQSGEPYLLVGQIDIVGVKVGSIVTVVDANQTVITNGRVELVNATGLTVRFEDGKRRPVVGDAAILF